MKKDFQSQIRSSASKNLDLNETAFHESHQLFL